MKLHIPPTCQDSGLVLTSSRALCLSGLYPVCGLACLNLLRVQGGGVLQSMSLMCLAEQHQMCGRSSVNKLSVKPQQQTYG